ncbi:hypothetical protein ATEIFO6365_0012035200 [Aspergillus terreus]|uniref:Xylanolytic transcriptional activator regulatory domain-containing protein n=1 Tax=Aspergillus terreus TaxID=33178 RepID=A0A5M3ZBC3_ASPTE|nr:hypothetical protein ATETN484_0013036200 [Aspergillus terreus]GFF20596.1 hypothetical protein ATEIFO6365_0012035200 [Aspergillus terreus]
MAANTSQSMMTESHIQENLFSDIPPDPDFPVLDFLYAPQWTTDSTSLAEGLEYLAYFTSTRGMGAFLEKATLRERQRLVLEDEMRNLPASGILTSAYDASPLPDLCFENLATDFTTDVVYNFDASASDFTINGLDPLEPKAQDIIARLETLVVGKRDKTVITIDWDPSTQELCHSFFTPSNIHRYLGYFWSLWYPNCPIVHRPSFNPQTAPAALVAVMVIIGACLSPHEEDARSAEYWLDSVEELVFTDNRCESVQGTPTSFNFDEQYGWKKRRIECIQMTYLTCSLQKREGSLEAQARIRRYRHATMVTLARDIGLSSGNHRTLSLDSPSSSWWDQFSAEEELIRTLTYVFLFDAALTIFHNSPPRMVVSELKMEVACPEACFQAESAAECFSALKKWENSVFWRDRLSISAVVRRMCQKDLDGHLVRGFACMGTLNMFTTVQCLHSLTFHLQNSIIFEPSLAPVETGLENWRRIWNEREPEDKDIPSLPDTLWKKIGFTCYAPEFWHLARILVAKMRSSTADNELDTSSPGQNLHRYDHTDMTDVNGLIMEYRRLNLGVTTST